MDMTHSRHMMEPWTAWKRPADWLGFTINFGSMKCKKETLTLDYMTKLTQLKAIMIRCKWTAVMLLVLGCTKLLGESGQTNAWES